MPIAAWMLRTSCVGIDRFRTLRSFDDAEKRSLLKLVRRAEHRLAPYEFWRHWLEIVALSTMAVFGLATILLSPYLFGLLGGRPIGIFGWVAGYAAAPVALLVVIALGATANAAAAYWGPRGALLARFTFAGAASSAVLLPSEPGVGHGALVVAAGAGWIVLAGVIGITLILELVFGAPMWILIRARATSSRRHSCSIDSFGSCVGSRGHPAHWTNATFRRDCIMDLEYAASCIERDLGRSYRASRELHAWLRVQCRGTATALRQLARDVALSPIGARERLRRQLHEAVRHAALQQWAELPSETPETKITRTRALATWLLGLVRAGLPAACLAGLQQTSYALHGAVQHYATAAVVLWAVTGLVPLIDRQYASKLRGISGLRSEAEVLFRDRLR
jgi:hypothetical protein